jgi:hypothetical protein
LNKAKILTFASNTQKGDMASGKTSTYYKTHPKAREKRLAYQAEFNKQPDQVKKRVELNAINAKNHASGKSSVGDGKDVSHTKSGTRLKSATANRGSNSDMPGDRRARPNNKLKTKR